MSSTWDPFHPDISTLRGRINRMFDQARERGDEGYEMASFTPPVDIHEDGESFTLHVDLPGVPRDSVEINVEQNTLFLRGERKLEKSVTEEGLRRAERPYGRFARTFTLPRSIDTQKIEATMQDGVLQVRLPKSAGTLPRKIQIA